MFSVKDVFISTEETPVLSHLLISRSKQNIRAHHRQRIFQSLNTLEYYHWAAKITPLYPEKSTFPML